MNTKEYSFRLSTNKIELSYKGSTVETFETFQTLSFVDKRFTASDKLNVIGVSQSTFSKFCFQKMLLINQNSNSFINVTLKVCDSLKDEEFLATSYLKEILKLDKSETIYLCQYKKVSFNTIFPQKIDHIRESDLIVSEIDYKNLLSDTKKTPCKFFEIYNAITQDSLIIKKSHIFVDKTLTPGTIRLSRKQRICLGIELPQYISDEQWTLLKEKFSQNNEDFQCVSDVYISSSHVLDKSAPYNKKDAAKKAISKYLSTDIRLIPVFESIYAKKRNILKKICDFYVGKSTISLICRRPYDIDEGLDIVRMSKSNMKLLGIDEMDKIILQYKNKKISCRVLEIDNTEAFLETNLPISTDLVVGIPAHIRKKLHIMDLSSSVKIDRDTAFIFRKSINQQIVPILLTLFSTNIFTDKSIILSALLSIIAIPIVVFFNLSSSRNKRS